MMGAEGAYVGRAIGQDRAGAQGVRRAAAQHRGSAFVEIFQNCPIFNDHEFDYVRDDKQGVNRIMLESGEPIVWGTDQEKALRQRSDGSIEVCAASDPDVLVHDASAKGPSLAFALSRVTQETHGGTPVGIFRDVERPVYDELMAGQIELATEQRGAGDLAALLHSGETWTIT